MSDSDLEKYSRVQLRDIAEHIDRNAYPERYAKINEILARPKEMEPVEETQEEIKARQDSDSWLDWISVEILIFLFILLLLFLGFLPA